MAYFFTKVTVTNILFEGWNTDSWEGVLLAAFIICVMTIIFESLKTLRAYVITRRTQSPLTYGEGEGSSGQGNETTSSQADLLSSLRIPVSIEQIQKRKMILFSLESLLHMFNFFYAYILMLVVMTYCVWFLISVVLGSAIGYFICHPVGHHLTAKYSAHRTKRSADHCCGTGEPSPPGASSVNDPGPDYEGHQDDTVPIMAEIT